MGELDLISGGRRYLREAVDGVDADSLSAHGREVWALLAIGHGLLAFAEQFKRLVDLLEKSEECR